MSPLPGKKVKLNPDNAVHDHLVHCNYLPSFDNFSILVHENKFFCSKLKKAFLKNSSSICFKIKIGLVEIVVICSTNLILKII